MNANRKSSSTGGISIKLMLFLAALGFGAYLIEDHVRAWWQWYSFRSLVKDIALFSIGIPDQNILQCVVLAGKHTGVDIKPAQVKLSRDIAEGKLDILVKWERKIDYKVTKEKAPKNFKLDIFEGLPMTGRECRKILLIPDEKPQSEAQP